MALAKACDKIIIITIIMMIMVINASTDVTFTGAH